MIIAGLMGALATTGGGGDPALTLVSTAYSPVNEGQQQSITVQAANWNNSIIYWRVTNSSNTTLTSQVNTASGSFYGGYATHQHTVSFTFNADATTEGPLSYYVKFSSSPGANDILIIGPETCNDTSFAVEGSLSLNGSTLSWGSTNATATTYAAYTYPDDSSGSVHTLTGSQYVLSPQFGVAPTLDINLWFYPTANNKVILGELGQAQEDSGWHLTMLEINSSNKLKGRVWEMAAGQALVSTGSVTLNAWNHVYLYYNHATTTIGMSLNNETAVTQGSISRHTSDTNHTYWGIGLTESITNMGSSARYQGKFDALTINTSITGSTYSATKAKYQPPLSLDFPATGSPRLLVSNTQSDWNLGTTFTIEFWSKARLPSDSSPITVMSQSPDNASIDVYYHNGYLKMSNGTTICAEPPVGGVPITVYNVSSPGGWNGVGYPGSWTNLTTTGGTGKGLTISVLGATGGYADTVAIVTAGSGYTSGDVITATGESSVSFTIGACTAQGVWTHVALSSDNGYVRAYYNGVEQSASQRNLTLSNSSQDFFIGRRGNNDFQYFNGKLAMIRISNTAKYTTAFDPSYSYGVEAGTKLMLGSAAPLVDSTGTHPISAIGSATTSSEFPSSQSLVFNQPEGDSLSIAASSDWNLGTTGTIEFWIKANNASNANINIPGGQWGLVNQGGWYYGMPNDNCILIGLTGGNLSIAQSSTADVQFAEPTAGAWTHVAVVYNSGTQKVYYNGVEQTKVSGNYLGNGWTNTSDTLYIGRLAPNYGSWFDGKMALIRISSAAKYVSNFTPSITYGVEADTKLFLSKVNPIFDRKGHIVNNDGVTTSSDFPS